ncbi:MAG: hypothetical protein HYU64_12935 [Armatimonadetes bacterium]|nr:hypothetical protein [Armatimonadota bacterium]
MKNEILSEVWRNRDEFAKRYNYDIEAMVVALREMESHPWNTVVDRRKQISDKLSQRTTQKHRR